MRTARYGDRHLSLPHMDERKEISVEIEEYGFDELKASLDKWHRYVMEQTRSKTITLYGPDGKEVTYHSD